MPTGDERRRDALVRAPVRRLQRHLNRAAWLRALVRPLWAAAAAFAAWRFLVRFESFAVGLLLFVVAALAWVFAAHRRRITATEAAVRADRLAEANGLLLTRLETSVGGWELELNAKVRAMRLPAEPVRRPLALSLLALLFVAVVLAVPAPPPRALPAPNAAAANKLAELEARAEALAREVPLEEGLQAELARLRLELDEQRFDAADWEAADGLDGALQQRAAEAAGELRAAEESARALEEALGAAAGSEGAAREQEALERSLMALSGGDGSAQRQLERLLGEGGQQANAEGQDSAGQAGERGAQSQGADPPQQGGGDGREQRGAKALSRGQAEDVRRALAQRQAQLAKSFGQQRSGAGESRSQGAGSQAGRGRGQGEGQGRADQQGEGQGERGRAGVGRGGGPGVLSFDDQGAVNPERLAFEPLPQGQGGDPDRLWGLRGVDPERSAEASSGPDLARGGAAAGAQSPGKRHEQMLPRNRELVRRYFGGE